MIIQWTSDDVYQQLDYYTLGFIGNWASLEVALILTTRTLAMTGRGRTDYSLTGRGRASQAMIGKGRVQYSITGRSD